MSEVLNAFDLLRRAARGENKASRELAFISAGVALEEGDFISWIEVLTFARLAYAQSNDATDGALLLQALGVLIGGFGCDDFELYRQQWQAESIAVASRLADQGLPAGETRLAELIESCGPAATMQAKEIALLMAEAEGA